MFVCCHPLNCFPGSKNLLPLNERCGLTIISPLWVGPPTHCELAHQQIGNLFSGFRWFLLVFRLPETLKPGDSTPYWIVMLTSASFNSSASFNFKRWWFSFWRFPENQTWVLRCLSFGASCWFPLVAWFEQPLKTKIMHDSWWQMRTAIKGYVPPTCCTDSFQNHLNIPSLCVYI